jgi:D-alanyl-D-alanine dipeptidase
VPFLLLAGALASACAPASAPARDPGPWPAAAAALADSLLRDVRAGDPSILVEARYAGSDNFTGQPLPGYGANRLLLRREAATALARVQAQLRLAGLGLKVFDGYRPIRATLAMVEWTERVGRTDLLDDGYIARRSRHNLGLAVDLTLVELATGRELPMGTPFDEFTTAAHTANASGEVAANRRRLVEAMEAAGFENYEQEWWHFSYAVPGDPPAFDVPVGGKR